MLISLSKNKIVVSILEADNPSRDNPREQSSDDTTLCSFKKHFRKNICYKIVKDG
jgi:hypothetical protein